MKLRSTFSRLLRKSLSMLRQKGSPMALSLLDAFHRGKLKVFRLRHITEAEIYSLCEHETHEHSHKCKSDVMQKYFGVYFNDDFVYIKEAMSQDDFLDTLAHEYVHYYTHQQNLTLSGLEEELSARIIGAQATGKKITRNSITSHIQDMKEAGYFSKDDDVEEADFEGTDIDKVNQLLSHFPRM